MAYIRFKDGFTITTASAIDKRIYLTKAEMLTAEDIYNLPNVYFCLCPDDGKFYLYNVNNTPNSETGKFISTDASIDFNNITLKNNLEQALNNSTKITNIQNAVDGMGPRVTQAESDIEDIQTWIEEVKLDGGIVQPSEGE